MEAFDSNRQHYLKNNNRKKNPTNQSSCGFPKAFQQGYLHCFEIGLSYGKATAAETATEMKVFLASRSKGEHSCSSWSPQISTLIRAMEKAIKVCEECINKTRPEIE